MATSNRHRVLVISQNAELRYSLVTLLSGYGYFVEEAKSRIEGIQKFRAQKQSILIIDYPILRIFTKRLFKLVKLIRKNAIVLIAAQKKDQEQAYFQLGEGAYDILPLPLKTSSLMHTLNRAQNYHQTIVENLFIKNLVFFTLILSPVWLLTIYLLLK